MLCPLRRSRIITFGVRRVPRRSVWADRERSGWMSGDRRIPVSRVPWRIRLRRGSHRGTRRLRLCRIGYEIWWACVCMSVLVFVRWGCILGLCWFDVVLLGIWGFVFIFVFRFGSFHYAWILVPLNGNLFFLFFDLISSLERHTYRMSFFLT